MRRTQRSGFTLIEVLLTLVIMAGILLTITQILRAARTSRDMIHNIQEQQLAGPAILQQLENDLRGLIIYDRDPRFALCIQNRVLAGFDADSIDFVGTTDSLLSHREKANEPPRRADINEIGYHLRPNPDSDDFLELYRREDFGVDDLPFEGGQFALLHDRVKGFEIRVYREDGVEAKPEESWGAQGDEFVGIPARIEVELTIELAPRLVREQLVATHSTITYKRTIRFPASLVAAQESGPVPLVPTLSTPVIDSATAGGGQPGGVTQGFGTPNGPKPPTGGGPVTQTFGSSEGGQ